MQLLFCDSCGRPLSEGALARGEATEHNGDTICQACEAKKKAFGPAPSAASGPLAHYAEIVWKCKSCKIPITALDLIEGRAARISDEVECVRCRGSASPNASPVAAVSVAAPSVRAPKRSKVLPATPRTTSHSSVYVAQAQREERRPVLPIVLIAIVLPMFALSLWYAISAQAKLNDVTTRGNSEAAQGPPKARPREMLDSPPEKPANTPAETGETAQTPEAVKEEGLPAGALKDLAAIEDQIARETITKLESRDLAVVWEGLIEAGSRRLIATRPWVRALLKDSDARTRGFACSVSAMLSDTSIISVIEDMAQNDKSQDVRDAAHRARARLIGKATRDLSDMRPDELEALRKQIEQEIQRQKSGAGHDGR
jgi:hypothetical protein